MSALLWSLVVCGALAASIWVCSARKPKHGRWQIRGVVDSRHPTLKEHFEVYRVINLGTKDVAFEWLKPQHRFKKWRDAWDAIAKATGEQQ